MGGMNLRLPFFVSLGLVVTACGSFDGSVDGTTTDGGRADAATGDASVVDSGTPVDGGTPVDSGTADAGTVTDSGVVVVDAGPPNTSLCDGLTPLGNGDFNSKIENGNGAFSSRANGYTAALEQDGGGQAFLPTKSLNRPKVCVSVDVTLNTNADNLSANYQLVGGQIGQLDVAQFGAVVNNGTVAIGYRNGAGAAVNVGNRRNFRLELLVDNTLTGSKLRYRVRTGGGQVLGEGEIAGGGGTGTVLQVGLGCANAAGNSCKQLSADGNNFAISGN